MAAGLQCWDASGNLVVDLGDYSTRFIGRYNVNFPRSVDRVQLNVPGVTDSNSFASVMGANLGSTYVTDYAPVCRSGGIDIIYVPGRNPSVDLTLYVEVYMFN